MSERHVEARQAIGARREAFAVAVLARQYGLQTGRWQRCGSGGRATSVRGAFYHPTYPSAAVAVMKPALIGNCAGLGYSDSVLTTTLACICHTLLEEQAPESGAIAAESIAFGVDPLGQSPATPAAFHNADAELGGPARFYRDALLGGERRGASDLILSAVRQGAGVQDANLHAFQPARRDSGQPWQMNRITVAQEHSCTGATQLILSQLSPSLMRTERVGRRLAGACMGDGHDELGARMVDELLEAGKSAQVLHTLICSAVKLSYPGSLAWIRAGIERDRVLICAQDEGMGMRTDEMASHHAWAGKTSARGTAGREAPAGRSHCREDRVG